MQAIMYELLRLQQDGYTPTRILVTQETLEAMASEHLQLQGIYIGSGSGTFNGLPVLPVRGLSTNFEIAVQPTR